MGLILAGLMVALAVVAPATQADVYNPADWAPNIWSDRSDYAPGATVTLSGANWQPGEAVHIRVNDDVGAGWSRDVAVTAGPDGTITDSFDLPETVIARYNVTATGASGAVATTTFTDGAIKVLADAGFTYTLSWRVFGGSNRNGANLNCTDQGDGVKPPLNQAPDSGTVTPAGLNNGVANSDAILLTAALTATTPAGAPFVNWTVVNGTFTTPDPAHPETICVPAASVANREYTAHYSSAPVVTPPPDQSATEGTGQPFSLGTFSDSNGPWTVTVEWGDGGQTVFNQPTAGSLGSQSHTYADDGTYTVSVSVKNAANQVGSTTFNVAVANVAPTVTLAGTSPVDESSAARTFTFTVTDPGTDGYTVKSGFPDCGTGGSFVSGSLVTNASGGSFDCEFLDGPASPTVRIQVRDADEPAGSTTADSNIATKAVQVDNVAPTITLSEDNDLVRNESTTEEREFSFSVSDPGADTPVVTASCGAHGDLVAGSVDADSFRCVFADGAADPGTETTISVSADDGDGGTDSDSQTVTIKNVAPTVTLSEDNDLDVDESTTAARTFEYTVTDPGADTQVTSVDCGDHGDLVAGSDTEHSFKCVFPNGDAESVVTASADDGDGGTDSDSQMVMVKNVAPTVTLSQDNVLTYDESKTAHRLFEYSVSDPGADVPVISADCGDDGELVSGSLDADSFECVFDDGDAETDVTVSADDGDGGTDSDSQTVTIKNVAPTVSVIGVTTVDEGDVETYTYTVTDPGDDGVSAMDTSCGANGDKVPGSDSAVGTTGTFDCTFPDGTKDTTVSAKATDTDGATGDAGTLEVHIANVAPTVTLTGADEVAEGDTDTYSYTVDDPGVNDTFTVDAGFPDCDFGASDNGVLVGTPEQDASGGSFKCRFPDGDKTATVKIKVTDSDGASTTDSEDVVVVEIANVAPEVTAAADQSSDEGESKSFDLGSFTDPGDDADWKVDVTWGDGGTDSFMTGTKDTLGSLPHTYADGPADYLVIVTVTDKDGASDSATFTIHVDNVAPVVDLTGEDSADEGQTKTYTYTVTDVGNDPNPTITEDCGDHGDYEDTAEPYSFDCTFPDGLEHSTVLVTADDGDTSNNVGSAEIDVTIQNVPPTVTLTGDDEVTEGTTHTYTFTVDDPGDDDFTVVDGDCDAGPTDNGVLVAGSLVTNADGGSLKCSFPDGDKTANVTVKVADSDGASSMDSEDVVVVQIANVAPDVTAAANQSSDEGESKSFDLGWFTDPGADADWTVSVDWGDGTDIEVFTKNAAGSLGTRAHTYGDGPALYTVTVLVVDKDGADDYATFDVSVANVAPVVTLTGADSANEGDSKVYDYTVTDAGDDPDPDITESCGDEGDRVDTPDPHSFECKFPDGPKSSTVSVTANDGDPSNNIGTDSIDVTVHNVAPKVTLTGDEHVDEGDIETYTYTVEDPGVNDTFTVNAGFPDCDAGATNHGVLIGTPVQTASGGSFKCSFPDGGATATVKIKVTDNDGGSTIDSEDIVVVDIANVVPSVTPPADQTAVEGSSKSFTLGSFSDPGPDNPWSVDIDWGDSSPHTTFTVSATGGLGTQPHTYPNGPATKTVTVKVTDKNGGVGTTTFKVEVANVNPTANTPLFVLDPVLGTATASFNYADPGWKDTHTNSFFRWSIDPAGVFTTATITGAEAIPPDATGNASYTRTLTPGCYNLTVTGTAQDSDGGQSAPLTITSSPTTSVHASGFRPPIMDNERNVAKYGNVVPVKVVLTNSCTGATVNNVPLYISTVQGAGSEIMEETNVVAESVSSADTTGQMRTVDGMYMYNLTTKGMLASKDYTIRIRLNSTSGPIILAAVLQPKK